MKMKTPKGTKDSSGQIEILKQKIIQECEKYFSLYGAERMDTPTFELTSILTEKYGDNEKEIYDIVSKGDSQDKEKLSLRYDLTVPFSRYVKMNRITKMKRYQIGKVFRRDQPGPNRYREFYQCDYDNLGNGEKWLMDAETLILLIFILRNLKEKFQLPEFKIKVNGRENLIRIISNSDIEDKLFTSICSSIDKLDKLDWNLISDEMLKKGLNIEQIEKLKENLDKGVENEELSKTLDCIKNVIGEGKEIEVDYKLARGLDYYTGLIFEVVLIDAKNGEATSSIAGGGRYDNLCNIPCVGFSLGIDRIVNYCKIDFSSMYDVWITSNKSENRQKELSLYKLKVATLLRNKGYKVGIESKSIVNNKEAISYALKNNINYIIFLGDRELSENKVTVKNLNQKISYEVDLKCFL